MTTLYTDISLSTIRVAHERARPVDNRTVADLTKSIAAHGLLQPIGVKATSTGYDLVWGLHRLEAMRQLGQDIIACKVMDADLSDDACRLVELRENLDRNELTGAERKAFAAEVGRLISKLSEKLQVEENSNLQSGWVLELADKIGSSQNTIRNWWGEFTKASGLSITPKPLICDARASGRRGMRSATHHQPFIPITHASTTRPTTPSASRNHSGRGIRMGESAVGRGPVSRALIR